jgi:hypothetical protein
MIIETLRATVVNWRLGEEVQSLFLTHALRQSLRFGQPPNNSSLQSTVPVSVRINVPQQLAKSVNDRHSLRSGG